MEVNQGMVKKEFTPPLCSKCGEEKLFDPILRLYYCKICDPQWHEELQKQLLELLD